MSKETDDLFDDEVTTGATLDSGTTIGGNQVFHLGNDGRGSGLDAETVDGKNPVQKGVKYVKEDVSVNTGISGNIETGFSTPCSDPEGLGLDSNDCIWHADALPDSIYEINQSGTVQSKFNALSNQPAGVGLDSNDCIWHSDDAFGNSSIYKIDRSGNVQSGFSSPSDNPFGVGLNTNDCIWHAAEIVDSIWKIDQSGTIETQFSSPSFDATGLGVDSSNSIFHSSGNDSIYEINQSGSVIKQFSSPSDAAKGVGLDSNDSIWHCDNATDSIYKISPDGVINKKRLQKL